MPSLTDHKSKELIRILGVGDPGTGKTGSLVAVINLLPKWGIQRVIIQDWDDGLDILSARVDSKHQALVYYETMRDEMKATQKGVTFRDSTAFTRGMALMNNWKVGDVDLGNCNSWGAETLFVCDTITGLGDACMGYAVMKDKIEDTWRATGAAMMQQGRYVQLLCALKCHVIVFSHKRFMGGGGQVVVQDKKDPSVLSYKVVDSTEEGTCYPSALGRQLPPAIARNFNIQLEWRMFGPSRKISTVPRDDKMAIKMPFTVLSNLPQETGLVDIFNAALDRE